MKADRGHDAWFVRVVSLNKGEELSSFFAAVFNHITNDQFDFTTANFKDLHELNGGLKATIAGETVIFSISDRSFFIPNSNVHGYGRYGIRGGTLVPLGR